MTFNSSDYVSILKYLGYATHAQNFLMVQQATANVSSISSALEDEVRRTIRELDKIQEQINDSRLGAGRSFQSGSAGTAQFYRGERLNELRQAGRQQVNTLAQLMNLSICRDVFAPTAVGGNSGRIERG